MIPALRSLAVLASAFAFALAGCGDDVGGGDGGKPRLTVLAAASLTEAFEQYGGQFDAAAVRLSFAGSDELAAQIRQGVEPDVYAAANTTLPEQLFEEDLVKKPVAFAGNRLVIAVPADSDEISSLDDLAADGVKLAIGSEDVPVGAYTREVLERLPGDESDAILGNVRSNEPDVSGVTGKLTQGAADAGFLYITDVAATNGRLEAIELPARLQPSVGYGIAVVEGAEQPEAAQEFIDGLLEGRGLEAMEQAGFEPPPK
ncbi:MAG: molybdate ABC transporter substrate-binding protein [Thermoleophilaceae bacterium]